MKKKKLLLTFVTGLLSLSCLTSCYFIEDFINGLIGGDSTVTPTENGTYKTPTSYPSGSSKDNLNVNNIGYGQGYRYLPQTGNSKILVVPIATTDYGFTTSQIDKLDKCFFGSASDTGWQSVSSFYETSSYNKLHITGEVTDVLNLGKSTSELDSLNEQYSKNNKNYTDVILTSALKTLESDYDLSDYDTDGDGYIDAVWMIYAAPSSSTSDLFWAYTTWSESTGTYDGKHCRLYSWASIDFLSEFSYSGGRADAHTYIHETGHMLGLDDYYSYDYDYSASNRQGNTDTPVGGIDMMDFNIGDHCSFSKYLLGWETPTVITPEYLAANGNTLTLASHTTSGESFLIPIYDSDGNMDYNGTAFDEYLLVEYFTPSGLNYKDSLTAYANGLQEYTAKGVLVYHVDARVGKVVARGGNTVWDGYAYDKIPDATNDGNWGYSYIYTFIYNNTQSYSWDSSLLDTGMSFYRGRLVSLLPASGKRINGSKTGYSNNSCLFKGGYTFGGDEVYSDFVFDDGSAPKYGFTVSNLSSTDCKLKFIDF